MSTHDPNYNTYIRQFCWDEQNPYTGQPSDDKLGWFVGCGFPMDHEAVGPFKTYEDALSWRDKNRPTETK